MKLSRFKWTHHNPSTYHTDTGADRTFCPTCGTSITYYHPDRGDEIDIIAATLEHPENYPPNRSIFAEEKLPWVICDTTQP